MDLWTVAVLIILGLAALVWWRRRRTGAAGVSGGSADDLVGKEIGIVYEDEHGNVTDRVITILRIYGHGERAYIDAHCHLRGDERTFRADRIEAYFDPATGEVIERP